MFGEDLSDANLLRRVRRNDPRAFGVLLRRHDPALRRLASRLLVDEERTAPVLHKAYTKAWRSAGVARLGTTKDEAVLSWLYRLVYNACVDELRRQPPAPELPPPSGPRVRLPKAPEERRLAGLRVLPPSERIPLVLIDSEGFSVEAAARILQRPASRVAADLERARRRWRDVVIGPPAPQPVPPAASEAVTAGPAAVEGAAAEDGASGNGAERRPEPAETAAEDADAEPDATPVPKHRRSPDITDPEDVVYAAEGVFDTERFTNLKQWFKDGRRQESPTS